MWIVVLGVAAVLLAAAGLLRRRSRRIAVPGKGPSGGEASPAAATPVVVVRAAEGGGLRPILFAAGYVLETVAWIGANVLILAMVLAAAKAVGVRLPPAVNMAAVKVLGLLGVRI